MTQQQTTFRAFEEIAENPIGLERETVVPVCEGLNVTFSSFQALYLQYEKHHFVVDGAEFYQLHEFFHESAGDVRGHIHELGERLNGLGGIPAASFSKLEQLSSFKQEEDGVFSAREMVEHDLAAEQAIIGVLRRQASVAESLGDRATRYLYEEMLLKTEERAFHLEHFLAEESLTFKFLK